MHWHWRDRRGDGDGDDSPRDQDAVLPDGGDEGGHAHQVVRLEEPVQRRGADVRDGAVLDDDLLRDLEPNSIDKVLA